MIEKNRDQYYWDLIIELEERRQQIESCLPEVSDSVFEEYILLWEVLGVFYEKMPSL